MNFKCGCLFLLLAFFMLFIGTAAAVEEITQEQIKTFSLEAPDGLTFTGVSVSNIDPNSNTTVYLDSYGDIYVLKVNSTKSYLSKWNFNISLTSPNGTTQYTSLSSIAPLATDFDLEIQYFWDSTFDNVFDIDIYTAIIPLSATLTTGDPTVPANLPEHEVLQFTTVSATSTCYFDLVLYVASYKEFLEQVNNNLWAPASEIVSDTFNWAWDMVLTFVEKIPGVGPYLSSVLTLAALTIDAIVFYFDLLLIEYPETTFLTIESFILGSAFCRRGNFWTKINRVCNAHLKIIELFINLAEAGVNMMSKIISAVADAINALKPV